MNRADPAAEPSMEDLLASIRLIISDDGGRPLPQDVAGERPVPNPERQQERFDHLPGDDVFDLTDEFVFPDPDDVKSAASRETSTPEPQPLPVEAAPFAHSIPAEPEEPFQAETPPPPADAGPQPPMHFEPHRQPRQDVRQRQAAPVSRSIWSRRELPNAGRSAQQDTARGKPDAAQAQPSQRSWAGDIQMPVPSGGPISLIASGETQDRLPEAAASATGPGHDHASALQSGSPARVLDSSGETAVAALAEKLARSTVEALDTAELKSAREVDFEHLNGAHKVEVAEKFADAIERESAMRDPSPLPTLLDEVFRQDFMRAEAPSAEPEDASVGQAAQARLEEASFPAPPAIHEDEEAVREREWPERAKSASAQRSAHQPKTHQLPLETPMASQSPVQAQFIGTAQPSVPANGGRTLEDAVREMLRPLLVQWLNDHMPRILENAIREEIATRGLLPRSTD